MTQTLTRPLTTDNRMLRATGAADIALPLGAGLRAQFSAPTMGGLAMGAAAQQRAGLDPLPFDREEEAADRQAVAQLSYEAQFADGAERDAILDRIDTISGKRKTALDARTRDAIAGGRMQTPVALAEQYGDLGLKFDRPMTPDQARLLAEGKRAEIIRNAIISKTPGGFVAGAAMFGTGLAAMATDPLEVATMFIPVVGQAGKAAAIARFGRVGGRVAVGVTEGAVGSALTEPAYFALSRSQQLDYTMGDALMNVGLGAVLGGGIGTVAGLLSRHAPQSDASSGVSADGIARPDAPASEATTAPVASKASDVSELPTTRAGAPAQATVTAKAPDDVARAAETRRLAAEQRPAAEAALRQFVTGQAVSVEPMMPRLGIQDGIDAMYREAGKEAKFPLVQALRRGVKVHPRGTFAEMLRAAGITPKTAPGLFSNKGHKDLDNLPADQWEESFPGISGVVGSSNGYLDPDGLAQAVIAELGGRPAFGGKAAKMAEIAEVEREASSLADVFEAAKAQGVVLRSEAEVRFVADALKRGDMDFALERLAVQGPDDQAAALARNAAIDPYADEMASLAMDRPFANYMDDDLADMEAMIAQIESDLGPDALADLAFARDVDNHAAIYADVAQAAAVCVARAG